MKIKTFTLKEANRLVPKIKGIFDDTHVLKKKIAILKSELDWLREFWKDGLHDSDNPDSEKYYELANEVEKLYTQIAQNMQKVQAMGCMVKDVDNGLVDFYSTVNGELAFLCWRYGESEIKYWHSVEGGFSTRQPIGKVSGGNLAE